MLFPVIKVNLKGSTMGDIVVGSNTHHKLLIGKGGNIEFLDLQLFGGTSENGYYEFVGKEGDYGYEIEMVTFEELIEIYKENIKMSIEVERDIKALIEEFIAEQLQKNGLKAEEIGGHTGGNMIR